MPICAARSRKVAPSASSAIVRPPEAEPVSAARMLVATASDTSGPPPMPSTASRTTSNAGSAATTAPKPTRLATLIAGSAEALTPASMVARRSGMRRKLRASTVRIAQVSAVDHRPDAGDGRRRRRRPIRASPGSSRSSRGRTISDSDEIDQNDDDDRRRRDGERRLRRRDFAVGDLGRIEFVRGRRALAQRLVVGERSRPVGGAPSPKPSPFALRRGLLALRATTGRSPA